MKAKCSYNFKQFPDTSGIIGTMQFKALEKLKENLGILKTKKSSTKSLLELSQIHRTLYPTFTSSILRRRVLSNPMSIQFDIVEQQLQEFLCCLIP